MSSLKDLFTAELAEQSFGGALNQDSDELSDGFASGGRYSRAFLAPECDLLHSSHQRRRRCPLATSGNKSRAGFGNPCAACRCRARQRQLDSGPCVAILLCW